MPHVRAGLRTAFARCLRLVSDLDRRSQSQLLTFNHGAAAPTAASHGQRRSGDGEPRECPADHTKVDILIPDANGKVARP